MALASAAAIASSAAAVGLYLNGRYNIVEDVRVIQRVKQGEKVRQARIDKNRLSPWYLVEDAVKKYPNARALWSRKGTHTYDELQKDCLRYAQWLLSLDVKPGDLVAVYLLNSSEFFILWLALACIGAAPAFINYNLEGKGLLHCLAVSHANLLIADEDEACQKRISEVHDELKKKKMNVLTLNDALRQEAGRFPAERPSDELRKEVQLNSPMALVYTSGTTGLPKGMAFTVGRFQGLGPGEVSSFDDEGGVDCWYVPMPLFHGTSSICSMIKLVSGVSIATSPKFSVKNFWQDVYDSGATRFIYVGETARYLLNAPPHPLERKHKLRGAFGNGLRPDVWKKLQDRFNIPEIIEFFDSSEGMLSLLNWCKGPFRQNCVGHNGLILRMALHNTFIPLRIDHDTGEIWRDPKTGRGQRANYQDGGEIVVAIPNEKAFPGYWNNDEATNKKFAKDVFKKGDVFYRSGDALRRDAQGKWFFMDRLGDTFRWKSENVSTAEVSECLGHYPGIAEANVYGVLVPHTDGRAGCAALHLDSSFGKKSGDTPDFNGLAAYLKKRLPKAAVPIFLRVVKASSHGHTGKQSKVPLRKEGIDPEKIGTEEKEGKEDAFYWLKPGSNEYAPFKEEDWKALNEQKAKL